MKIPNVVKGLVGIALAAATGEAANAFCGFYVAQADSKLFNQSSEVVLSRDGDHTVMTMVNDYQGDMDKFAVVIPVPVAIQKDAVSIGDKSLVDAIDRYSAPRLTEYWDPDPCPRPVDIEAREDAPRPEMDMAMGAAATPAPMHKALQVKVEASYSVGEYDIVILSAKDSGDLVTWLTENNYRIPDGAEDVLGSYVRQNMHFFVAKVNLREQERTGSPFLRPIQIRYDSPKFMLPIRLGMVNARGPQELFVYALTSKGRVETTNYRTTKLPTQVSVPEYVKDDFGPFYKAMFSRQVAKQGMTTIFTEYAWPLSIACDPCSADPITTDQLKSLGVGWVQSNYGQAQNVYLTRLHLRYDKAHFPEDLVFQETADSSTWQAVYSINHPFNGDTSCAAGRQYEKTLAERTDKEVGNLEDLTGWSPDDIDGHLAPRAHPWTPPKPKSWWDGQQKE